MNYEKGLTELFEGAIVPLCVLLVVFFASQVWEFFHYKPSSRPDTTPKSNPPADKPVPFIFETKSTMTKALAIGVTAYTETITAADGVTKSKTTYEYSKEDLEALEELLKKDDSNTVEQVTVQPSGVLGPLFLLLDVAEE